LINFTENMVRYFFLFCFVCTIAFADAQTIHPMRFDELQSKIEETKDSIVVLNFWATWCAPCVKELPYFEQLNKKYAFQKVKVILVNLDFNSKMESSAVPFVKKKNLQSEIIHITDTDPNTWINKIDTNWSGAIPATIVYNASHEKIKFIEGETTFDELEKIILPYTK
jgi:thiol-disulfide isomerase/thioredoxin